MKHWMGLMTTVTRWHLVPELVRDLKPSGGIAVLLASLRSLR